MPKRIQRKRTKGWRMPPNTVYVGRPTVYGNPFRIGLHGTHEECVALYKRYLSGEITAEDTEWRNSLYDVINGYSPYTGKILFWARLLEPLRGKNLACWCPLIDDDGNSVPCHADVLLELANARKETKNELR